MAGRLLTARPEARIIGFFLFCGLFPVEEEKKIRTGF